LKGIFRLLPVTLCFLLFIVGCSYENIEKVNVFEMESFSKVKEGSLRTFTDLKDVNIFEAAFNNAKKEPGIVDMADPEYKVELGSVAYFLWISEEHGTIMNLNDTHTIYTLSKNSAKAVYELLY